MTIKVGQILKNKEYPKYRVKILKIIKNNCEVIFIAPKDSLVKKVKATTPIKYIIKNYQ